MHFNILFPLSTPANEEVVNDISSQYEGKRMAMKDRTKQSEYDENFCKDMYDSSS
jgi:hypothetical protein